MNTSWVGEVVRTNHERVVIWAAVVLIVLVTAFGWYVTTPLHGDAASIASVHADERVTLTHQNGGYALEPADRKPRAALVFYPGGHVSADAYLASLASLVTRADVAVYVPEIPFHFAILDPGAADDVIAAHPNIQRWFVGGHSLGGVAACEYASNHHDQVDGLVLFASYCEASVTPNVSTLSVTGSADTVLDRETYRDRRENLPRNASVVPVRGMNHSEFGSYTGQRGDQPAPIGYRTAHDRLANAVVPWVENRTARSS